MLFSSLVFIWFFLPFVFIVYHLLGQRFKNIFLLIFSLLFYAWGEPRYILLMLFSILINFLSGLLIDKCQKTGQKRMVLIVCLLINLGLLGYFKYFDFAAKIINMFAGSGVIALRNIVLPIGISFYTFQALSYVVDVYRKENKVQKNIFYLALYVSFFPQLIAGPIVKYHDIEHQIEYRKITTDKIVFGIKRFVLGLGKKLIFANAFASVVDQIFGLPFSDMTAPLIWFGIILYALQIYYDFSGYSDMAIGLGKMFGFDFLENFNYPYISTSIQEFWRRWHISLSTWFREYVYIPLGGNRKGKVRTYINLGIVFFATGLWHGASFNYILWGLYHGFFLIIERMFLGNWLKKNKFKLLNHVYTLFVVLMGWLMFRIESLRGILTLTKQMFFGGGTVYNVGMFADKRILLLAVLGIALSGPIQMIFKKIKTWLYQEDSIYIADFILMICIMLYCTMLLISNTYNPFIYFRF